MLSLFKKKSKESLSSDSDLQRFIEIFIDRTERYGGQILKKVFSARDKPNKNGLVELDLRRAHIRDEELNALSDAIAYSPVIRHLDIRDNHITRDGVCKLLYALEFQLLCCFSQGYCGSCNKILSIACSTNYTSCPQCQAFVRLPWNPSHSDLLTSIRIERNDLPQDIVLEITQICHLLTVQAARLTAIKLFYDIDKDKSGDIDSTEVLAAIKKIPGLNPNKRELRRFIDEADTNRDGKISQEEFLQVVFRNMSINAPIYSLPDGHSALNRTRNEGYKLETVPLANSSALYSNELESDAHAGVGIHLEKDDYRRELDTQSFMNECDESERKSENLLDSDFVDNRLQLSVQDDSRSQNRLHEDPNGSHEEIDDVVTATSAQDTIMDDDVQFCVDEYEMAASTGNDHAEKILNLCQQGITSTSALPLSLYVHDYSHLEVLNLSENSIQSISALSLPELPSLKQLNLSHNSIQRIDGLSLLRSLAVLDLSHNQIARIGGLLNNVQLEELHMSFNAIKTVVNLEHLSKLRILDLRHNHIASTKALRTLSLNGSLSHLSLEENPITQQQRYRSTITHLLSHLVTLDNTKLPPSSTNAQTKAKTFHSSTITHPTLSASGYSQTPRATSPRVQRHQLSSQNVPPATDSSRIPKMPSPNLTRPQTARQHASIDRFTHKSNSLHHSRYDMSRRKLNSNKRERPFSAPRSQANRLSFDDQLNARKLTHRDYPEYDLHDASDHDYHFGQNHSSEDIEPMNYRETEDNEKMAEEFGTLEIKSKQELLHVDQMILKSTPRHTKRASNSDLHSGSSNREYSEDETGVNHGWKQELKARQHILLSQRHNGDLPEESRILTARSMHKRSKNSKSEIKSRPSTSVRHRAASTGKQRSNPRFGRFSTSPTRLSSSRTEKDRAEYHPVNNHRHDKDAPETSTGSENETKPQDKKVKRVSKEVQVRLMENLSQPRFRRSKFEPKRSFGFGSSAPHPIIEKKPEVSVNSHFIASIPVQGSSGSFLERLAQARSEAGGIPASTQTKVSKPRIVQAIPTNFTSAKGSNESENPNCVDSQDVRSRLRGLSGHIDMLQSQCMTERQVITAHQRSNIHSQTPSPNRVHINTSTSTNATMVSSQNISHSKERQQLDFVSQKRLSEWEADANHELATVCTALQGLIQLSQDDQGFDTVLQYRQLMNECNLLTPNTAPQIVASYPPAFQLFRDIESAKIALSRLLDVMESNSPGSPQVSSYVQAILQSELGRRLNLANSFSSQDSNAQGPVSLSQPKIRSQESIRTSKTQSVPVQSEFTSTSQPMVSMPSRIERASTSVSLPDGLAPRHHLIDNESVASSVWSTEGHSSVVFRQDKQVQQDDFSELHGNAVGSVSELDGHSQSSRGREIDVDFDIIADPDDRDPMTPRTRWHQQHEEEKSDSVSWEDVHHPIESNGTRETKNQRGVTFRDENDVNTLGELVEEEEKEEMEDESGSLQAQTSKRASTESKAERESPLPTSTQTHVSDAKKRLFDKLAESLDPNSESKSTPTDTTTHSSLFASKETIKPKVEQSASKLPETIENQSVKQPEVKKTEAKVQEDALSDLDGSLSSLGDIDEFDFDDLDLPLDD